MKFGKDEYDDSFTMLHRITTQFTKHYLYMSESALIREAVIVQYADGHVTTHLDNYTYLLPNLLPCFSNSSLLKADNVHNNSILIRYYTGSKSSVTDCLRLFFGPELLLILVDISLESI